MGLGWSLLPLAPVYSYLQSVVTRLMNGRGSATDCGRFEAGLEVCSVEPSIDDVMQQNVLRPLGMTSSGFFWTSAMEANIAWGHDPSGQTLKTSRKPSGPAVARYGVAGSSWALGWEIDHAAGGDIIRHGGGNPGYSCFVAASLRG